VLLRDGTAGLQVLLLHRARRLANFAGLWVFPGGVLERQDRRGEGKNGFQAAARTTAVRELKEETGLALPAADLVPLARWTAPEVMPRRFDTWFFLAAAPQKRVQIDHSEISGHRWMSPQAALQAHRAGRLPLFPPTWVTLHHLKGFRTAPNVLMAAAESLPFHYAPKVVQSEGVTCFIYGDDAAYEYLQLEAPGPRHRLWVRGNDWHYEYAPSGEKVRR
jgi:8-oxo-dGTP pyrophosphatase MutT (NUDIX family)